MMNTCILVVQDDTNIRLCITRNLRQYGYFVLEASNSDVALNMLRLPTLQIDLVVCDDSFKGLSCSVLSLLVRPIRPRMPIVLLCDRPDLHHDADGCTVL